jgi:hypothetical protein
MSRFTKQQQPVNASTPSLPRRIIARRGHIRRDVCAIPAPHRLAPWCSIDGGSRALTHMEMERTQRRTWKQIEDYRQEGDSRCARHQRSCIVNLNPSQWKERRGRR